MVINEIRQIVYDKLSAIFARVYYQQAPQKAQIPYVVYSFPAEMGQHKKQDVQILQIDITDCERGGYNVAREIENSANEVDLSFNYLPDTTWTVSAWFRRISRIAVPFPEESNVWRRELRYEVRIYDRS